MKERSEGLKLTLRVHPNDWPVHLPIFLLTTMVKSKAGTTSTAATSKNGGGTLVNFPRIGGTKHPRSLSSPSILVPDQVVLYRDALTSQECREIISIFDDPSSQYKLEPSPPARKGEAHRTNSRFSQTTPDFAKQLYEQTGIQKEVAEWPTMFPDRNLVPVGLSSNIRVYRYDVGDVFGCHYDDHSTDPHYGPSYGKSEWTLLFYLTGEEDGVEGGQTVFYTSHSIPKRRTAENTIQAPLLKGAALFHRHGKVSSSECAVLVSSDPLPPGMHAP
jgi:hypothetical protein